MSSIQNEFNPYGYYPMNHGDFVPIQMNPNLKNHQPEMVPSTFVTSNNTNHATLFSSSPAYTHYHDSQTSSSSLRIKNSCVAYQMRSNMFSSFSMPCTAQISGFVKLSQVSITQTITERYCSIVPTNNMVTVQNNYEHVNHVMTSNPTFWNSTSHPPNIFDKHYENFTAKPIDYSCLQQDSANHQHIDRFSSSAAKRERELSLPKDGIDYVEDTRSEDENDGLIHNLPNEKEGSFICLKCNSLFHTPQLLASHIKLVDCRSETNEERKKRLKVNHQEVQGKPGGRSCRRKLRQ